MPSTVQAAQYCSRQDMARTRYGTSGGARGRGGGTAALVPVPRRSARLADAVGGNRKDHEVKNNGGSRSPQPVSNSPSRASAQNSPSLNQSSSPAAVPLPSLPSVSSPPSPAHCQSSPLKSVPRPAFLLPSPTPKLILPSPVQAVPSVLPLLVSFFLILVLLLFPK